MYILYMYSIYKAGDTGVTGTANAVPVFYRENILENVSHTANPHIYVHVRVHSVTATYSCL